MNNLRSCLLLLLLLLPGRAHALCVGAALASVPANATFQSGAGEYRVFDSVEHMQTLNFQVTSIASVGGCRYYITLDAGSSGNTSQRRMVRTPDTLDYNAYTTLAKTHILNDTGSYNGSNVISGTFAFVLGLLQTNNHSLYWSITPLLVRSAEIARFEDTTVYLRLWAEGLTGFVNTPGGTMPITFRAKAESDVDLSLVDASTPFNINDTSQTVDFGDLTSGEFLAYDTIVRSNDGYIVTLESQNNQVMLHESNPAVPDNVPYSVLFGGSPANLSSGNPVTVATSTGTTPGTGQRFATRFTVGTLSGAQRAGNYGDVINVTLSAN